MSCRTFSFLALVATKESTVTWQEAHSFSKLVMFSTGTESPTKRVLYQSTMTTGFVGFSKPVPVGFSKPLLFLGFSNPLVDFSKSDLLALFFSGFFKPELEELACSPAPAGVRRTFLGFPSFPRCLEPPPPSLARLCAREVASFSWHFFWAFSKAARCFTKHWELAGSSFSKADHCMWALLSLLAWDVVPCPKGLPFLLGGPSGSCIAFPSFGRPIGFLFQESWLSFPRKQALSRTRKLSNSSATKEVAEGCVVPVCGSVCGSVCRSVWVCVCLCVCMCIYIYVCVCCLYLHVAVCCCNLLKLNKNSCRHA